ncbi:MAG: hypothetical protein ABSB57_05740 [Dehalococcoidia bacterium]|jgi:hypothetical protein
MVSEPAPSEDEDRLLELVPADGSSVGNKSLREKLGWEPAHYFQVRDRLVERRVLSIGRGYGGSVYRVRAVAVPKAPEQPAAAPAPQYRTERELYKPVEEALRDGWSKTLRHSNYLVQITAAQGRKVTGGMWTRPDITVVSVDMYAYVPGKFLELITYEVKGAGNCGVEGVFEAASHSRFATKTYLLIYTPRGLPPVPTEQLERLQAECTRFGIGLGFFQEPGSYDTYDFVLDPDRRVPDPAEMDRFISQQLSDANKRHIVEWLR